MSCKKCGGRKSRQTYRGVKAVRRAYKEEVFDRVLVEIQTYHNRTYHFSITADQLKQLLGKESPGGEKMPLDLEVKGGGDIKKRMLRGDFITPCSKCPNRFELSDKCYEGKTCFACPKYIKYHKLGGK